MPPERDIVQAPEPHEASPPWVLTGLDRANLLLVLRGTWIFEEPLDVARMKEALGQVLALYPHLAGRMVGGKRVELTNQGVPFEAVEEPELTVEEVCDAPEQAGRFAPPLHKGRVKRGQEAPMTARVTRLADGSVLAVRCIHACLDGSSFYTMVRNWSWLCSGRDFPAPVLDQSLVPVPLERPRAELLACVEEQGWRRPSLFKVVTALPALLPSRLLERTPPIHVAAGELRGLKRRAIESTGREDLSTSTALSAHLARMCALLHGLPDGTRCQQVFVVDGRERAPGLPAPFAGNAASQIRGAAFEAGASFGEIAARAHDALAPFVARPSPPLAEQMALGREIMRRRLLRLPYDVAAMHTARPTVTYLNNFARMPVYDLDFGEPGHPLRPVRAIPHDLPDPVLFWPAPPDRGGVEVYLTGVAARAAARQPEDGEWWRELRRFEGGTGERASPD